VSLEREDGRARVRLHGAAGPDSPATATETNVDPAPGFDLRLSPEGAIAQLWAARSILAAHGGEVSETGPAGISAAGPMQAYEVDLAIAGNSQLVNKE
jgi:hypothetical protein